MHGFAEMQTRVVQARSMFHSMGRMMNKQTLIWTLIVAVPVGLAALASGYIYRETGKLPFQQTETSSAEKGDQVATGTGAKETLSQSAKAPEASSGAQTDTDVQVADEASDAPEDPSGLSFDVVGVEPTGETVVAGRSDSGAIVAMVANGKVVGKSIANEAGEWTIILDEPLKPGDYDVGLQVHDQDGKLLSESEQRLAVSLPEGGKDQPLVVLNTPEGPSDVIQKPAAAPTETQVASVPAASENTAASDENANMAAAPEAASNDERADDQQQVADAPAETADEPAEQQIAAAPEQDAPEATVSGTAAVNQGQEQTTGSGAAAAPDVETAPKPAEMAKETETASAQPATSTPASSETAKLEPSSEAGASDQQSGQGVTVEAVESEPDKVFIAGTGKPGQSVRVYVGDEFQGETQVNSSGKWLVQGSKNISEGDVEVRADLIGEDGNAVDARAAVTFEKEEDQQIVLTRVVATGTGGSAGGQEAGVKKSLPVVIIRKGDNLWRISRRLYGDGFRYTTIYQANQGQIRNPDLIYPGQVFLTPEGDLNWKPSSSGEANNG